MGRLMKGRAEMLTFGTPSCSRRSLAAATLQALACCSLLTTSITQTSSLAKMAATRSASASSIIQTVAYANNYTLQITTLETIARMRHLGALQSNLASKLNITNANFFYVVKVSQDRLRPRSHTKISTTSFPLRSEKSVCLRAILHS